MGARLTAALWAPRARWHRAGGCGVVAAFLLLALFWLDRSHSQAGLLMLLILVGSVGTAHGVLDTVLLLRLVPGRVRCVLLSAAYLWAAVTTALLLQAHPAEALIVLLSLSLWHFGEPFVDQSAMPAWQQLLQRLVRGGAPVLMPALVARQELAPLAHSATGGEVVATALLWGFWTSMAWAWLLLLGLCLISSFLHTPAASMRRRQWLSEVAVIAALYLLVSPLMAFALYFGLYHAVGHMRRVVQTSATAAWSAWARDWRVWASLVLTLLLGAALVAHMLTRAGAASWPEVALRSVILILVAVSVPHVVLISWWAQRLRAS
jgi:beta-carotene 15,15'-dioxygenase